MWTEQDRSEILALAYYRNSLCPCGCGHFTEDTFSHEEVGPTFVASYTACRARVAMVDAQDQAPKSIYERARLWRVDKKG